MFAPKKKKKKANRKRTRKITPHVTHTDKGKEERLQNTENPRSTETKTHARKQSTLLAARHLACPLKSFLAECPEQALRRQESDLGQKLRHWRAGKLSLSLRWQPHTNIVIQRLKPHQIRGSDLKKKSPPPLLQIGYRLRSCSPRRRPRASSLRSRARTGSVRSAGASSGRLICFPRKTHHHSRYFCLLREERHGKQHHGEQHTTRQQLSSCSTMPMNDPNRNCAAGRPGATHPLLQGCLKAASRLLDPWSRLPWLDS